MDYLNLAMNVLFKKKLLVLGLLGWIESVNAQEDHLNTLMALLHKGLKG